MKIAVIGSGNIGGTLGRKWADAGHQVTFGARDPGSPKTQAALQAAGGAAKVDTIEAALAGAEVILLALPGVAVADMVAQHGPALDGKLVIDATNQFGQPVMNGLATIAGAAPRATIYRAFNSLGWENFADPLLDGIQADLLYAGPDGPGREAAEQLIADIGLRPVWVGDLSQAPLVDNLGALWGALAFGQRRGRRIAFKVLGV